MKHVAMYALAALLSYIGLGVGLQVSQPLAYTLWGVAALTVVGNMWWLIRKPITRSE